MTSLVKVRVLANNVKPAVQLELVVALEPLCLGLRDQLNLVGLGLCSHERVRGVAQVMAAASFYA